jgi:(2Fe-2S) ferredoxin
VDREDVDEILQEHLIGGRVVERLRLPDKPVVTQTSTQEG